jgi:hypothetical protein
VLGLFAEWHRRGYGEITYPRANQTVFVFGGDCAGQEDAASDA